MPHQTELVFQTLPPMKKNETPEVTHLDEKE
jgi:hypothetical protein